MIDPTLYSAFQFIIMCIIIFAPIIICFWIENKINKKEKKNEKSSN